MSREKKARRWMQDGIVWCSFVLMGLLAIPACLSFLLIAIVWQTTEALQKALEHKR